MFSSVVPIRFPEKFNSISFTVTVVLSVAPPIVSLPFPLPIPPHYYNLNKK